MFTDDGKIVVMEFPRTLESIQMNQQKDFREDEHAEHSANPNATWEIRRSIGEHSNQIIIEEKYSAAAAANHYYKIARRPKIKTSSFDPSQIPLRRIIWQEESSDWSSSPSEQDVQEPDWRRWEETAE